MDLKGMNRYQHFGLRRPWLEHFFEHKENCFTMGSLGTRQYDSLRVWLKEAGLLTATGKGAKSGVPTPLFNKVQPLGAGNTSALTVGCHLDKPCLEFHHFKMVYAECSCGRNL